MIDLEPAILMHHLAIKIEKRLVKQAQDACTQIGPPNSKLKVEKASFTNEVQYPIWLANIVPIKKKNG